MSTAHAQTLIPPITYNLWFLGEIKKRIAEIATDEPQSIHSTYSGMTGVFQVGETGDRYRVTVETLEPKQ